MRAEILNCDDVRTSLARSELNRGVEDHLLGCEGCAALVVRHLAEQESPAASEIDELLASVELEIDADRGVVVWLRSLATEVRWLIAIGASSVLVLLTAALARHVDIGDMTCPSAAIAAIYTVLLGAVLAEGVRPMHHRELGFSQGIGWGAVLVPAAVTLVGFIVPMSAHGPARQDCFPLGLLVATCLVGLLRLLDRSAHRSGGTALLAVAAGGIAANLALMLHCADARMEHVLPVHASIGVVLALIYFGPGRRWQTRTAPRG